MKMNRKRTLIIVYFVERIIVLHLGTAPGLENYGSAYSLRSVLHREAHSAETKSWKLLLLLTGRTRIQDHVVGY